jgi:hypothetical protein
MRAARASMLALVLEAEEARAHVAHEHRWPGLVPGEEPCRGRGGHRGNQREIGPGRGDQHEAGRIPADTASIPASPSIPSMKL